MNSLIRLSYLKILLILLASSLISCSSFNLWKKEETVPKGEYEKLLKKYESLVKKSSPKLTTESVNKVDDSQSVKEFKIKLSESAGVTGVISSKKSYNKKRVQKDVGLLFQAYEKYRNKKYGDVVIILKELENSQVRQIRAQGRYLLGLTMKDQGELDLSMQIFEEILLTMRGTVFSLLSLQQLIDNTRKLGLNKKNEYFTLLYERFFN